MLTKKKKAMFSYREYFKSQTIKNTKKIKKKLQFQINSCKINLVPKRTFLSSSVVEQTAVNRLAGGSNPSSGVEKDSCET